MANVYTYKTDVKAIKFDNFKQQVCALVGGGLSNGQFMCPVEAHVWGDATIPCDAAELFHGEKKKEIVRCAAMRVEIDRFIFFPAEGGFMNYIEAAKPTGPSHPMSE